MYIMNATITPNSILPSMASTAPTTHTTTYPKLPTKFMIGIIRPDRNWLFPAGHVQVVVVLLELLDGAFLAAVCLDHGVAGVHFLDVAVDVAERHLLGG